METLSRRTGQLRRGMATLAVYAMLAGAVSMALSVPHLMDGDGFGFSRSMIGIVGIAAGLLALSGVRIGLDGWQALALWSALQVPVYADEKGGNYFRQLLEIPMGMVSSRSVNGEIVEYTQIGLNVIGIALLIILARLRERWTISQRDRLNVAASPSSNML